MLFNWLYCQFYLFFYIDVIPWDLRCYVFLLIAMIIIQVNGHKKNRVVNIWRHKLNRIKERNNLLLDNVFYRQYFFCQIEQISFLISKPGSLFHKNIKNTLLNQFSEYATNHPNLQCIASIIEVQVYKAFKKNHFSARLPYNANLLIDRLILDVECRSNLSFQAKKLSQLSQLGYLLESRYKKIYPYNPYKKSYWSSLQEVLLKLFENFVKDTLVATYFHGSIFPYQDAESNIKAIESPFCITVFISNELWWR